MKWLFEPPLWAKFWAMGVAGHPHFIQDGGWSNHPHDPWR
jgi:hypothetical protein